MVGSVAPRSFPIITELSRSSIVFDTFNSSLEIMKVWRRNMVQSFENFLKILRPSNTKMWTRYLWFFFRDKLLKTAAEGKGGSLVVYQRKHVFANRRTTHAKVSLRELSQRVQQKTQSSISFEIRVWTIATI